MKKVCSIILAVMMVVSMIPVSIIPATAAEVVEVNYIDRTWDAEKGKIVETSKTASAAPINSSTEAITLDGGWYYVSGNVEITAAITVSGTPDNPTCIILADGCKLTVSSGIRVNSGKALAIYAQTAGTGKLETEGSSGVAGIGGAAGKACGTITISGGTINATGGGSGATGIGGGKAGAGGTITINGGTITAVGTSAGSGAAGIGGSYSKEGGTVTINGGTVNATGGYGGAGIGGGCDGKFFTVTVNGGTVTATGGYGDDVTCSNGGAGIGSGSLSQSTGSTVTINGGNVTAIGNHGGAGIGSGCYSDDDERTITITGGNITAAGANGGSGIGGGYYSNGTDSTITITDGTVTATGADGGAGIGGGQYEEGGAVTITGGTVTATGASGGAGIGGGDRCESHGVLKADYDVMRAGDAAPGEDTALDDYLTARSTYAYIHTHKFDSYTDNENGTHSAKCACGEVSTVKTGHTFEDGKCTACGAAQFVSVAYLDEHGESKTEECTLINPAMTDWSGWMAVDGTVTIDGNVTMSDDTCLILKDGATLNVNGKISGNSGNKKLTVYVQSTGMNTGKLNVEYKATDNNDKIIYGNLTVNGGTISIKTTPDSQKSIYGIHGSLTVNGGDVEMYIKSDMDGSALIFTYGSCQNGLKVTGGSLKMTGVSSQSLRGVYASTQCTGDAVYVSGGTVTITLTTSDAAIGVYNSNSNIKALYVTGGEVSIAIESNNTKSYAINQSGTENAITLIDGTINLNKTGDTKKIIYSSKNVNVSAPKVEWSNDGKTYVVWDTISSLKSYNHLRLTNPPQAYLVEGHEPTVTENGLYNARIVVDDVIKTEKVYETDKSITFEQWYLRTMIQYQAGEDGALDIRFASMLDENLDQYMEAGFIVEVNGQKQTLPVTEAVQSFVANDKTYTIGDFSEADDYFFLQNTVFAASLVKSRADVKVTPFVTLMDGKTTLKGASVTFNLGTIADIAGIRFKPD